MAFKARETALPPVKARFEFTICSVTELVTMGAAPTIFGTDVEAHLQFKAHTLGRG
jgi:hypothetical protein